MEGIRFRAYLSAHADEGERRLLGLWSRMQISKKIKGSGSLVLWFVVQGSDCRILKAFGVLQDLVVECAEFTFWYMKMNMKMRAGLTLNSKELAEMIHGFGVQV